MCPASPSRDRRPPLRVAIMTESFLPQVHGELVEHYRAVITPSRELASDAHSGADTRAGADSGADTGAGAGASPGAGTAHA